MTVSASRDGNAISVKVEGSGKPFTFAVAGLGDIVSVEGSNAALKEGVVSLPAGAKQVEFTIHI
ncbi:hypothetical protein D3C80_1794000 [compost metagenome]